MFKNFHLEIGEPVVIEQGAVGDQAWGHYQFPNLYRTTRGHIAAGWGYASDTIEYTSHVKEGIRTAAVSEDEGKTWRDKTPEDEAHAFTFGINVDKYDSDNKSKKLPGAEFILYYTKSENGQNVNYYAKVLTKAFIEANPGLEINGRKITMDDRGIVYGWTTNKDEASVLTTNENGKIFLRGLDAGLYYLQETKAPAGYNLMETPVKVEIAPTYDKDGNLTSVEYKVDDIKQESNTVGVRNSSGSTLPVTGGVGTTMFYVFGSIMVVAAVVLLVTKKRMAV
jgi:LPXTG-motif cell wall-anchored protein